MRSGNKRGREEEDPDGIEGGRRSLQAMFRGIQRYDLESVLEALRKHPELASESFAFANNRKAKPLSIVLRHSVVSLDVVQEIYKHYPAAASCGGIKTENQYQSVVEESLYPLFLACCQDLDDEVVEFLAQNSEEDVISPDPIPEKYRGWTKRAPTIVPYLRDLFVKGTKYTGINSPANTPLLSLAKVKALLHKFPKLMESGWKPGGHDSLLEDALKAGYSQEILAYIVSQMPEPKSLGINGPTSYSPEQLDSFCWVLNNSPSLKKLTWVTASPGGLSMMLSILGIGQEDDDSEPATTNAITSLQLCFTKFEGDAEVLDIVEKVIRWGQLKALKVEANLPEYDDEDEPKEEKEIKHKALETKLIALCRLLRHDQQLQSFSMNPPWITTKKALQVLAKTMEQNTSLREASLASESKLGKFPSFKRIQLYAKLNQGQRASARNPSTTIPALVELLEDLPNHQTERGPNAQQKELHNMVYLFLREAPGLWSKAWDATP